MKKLLLISSLLVLGTAAIGQVKIGTNPLTFATNANLQVEGTTTAQQFIVLKNGNVGIGTNAPTKKLEVTGDVLIDGGGLTLKTNQTIQGILPEGGPAGLDLNSLGGTVRTGAALAVAGAATGNRASAIDLVSADGVGFSTRIIRDAGVDGLFRISNAGAGGILINSSDPTAQNFTIAGTTGFVGINKTAAGVPLDVNGVIRVGGNGVVNGNGTQFTFNDNLVGGTGNAVSGFLNNKGTGTATGGFSFATTSDNVTINNVLEIGYTGNIIQNAAGYLKVATGTTAERPATASAGMIRFNTTLVKFEGYDGTAWQLLN